MAYKNLKKLLNIISSISGGVVDFTNGLHLSIKGIIKRNPVLNPVIE